MSKVYTLNGGISLLLKIVVFLLYTGSVSTAVEIKNLYVFYSPSHEELYKNWFLPSLQDDFNVIVRNIDQQCNPVHFHSVGWSKTVINKINLILDAIQAEWGGAFVYSDVDIQFFKPFKQVVEKLIEDNDILFQKDSPGGTKCSGFFVCKANEFTYELWQKARDNMVIKHMKGDQAAVNGASVKGIKCGLLPDEFFGGGTLTARIWKPGNKLSVPDNIIMHHANWTLGVENKIAQLKYVKQVVDNR